MEALASLKSQGVKVNRLTADSRKVAAGIAFAAYPGERLDGRDFIAQAIDRGASAILWEQQDFIWKQAWSVPNAGVAGLKQAIGSIASEVYGHPSERLHVIGVTGTNGKTSVSQWLAQCCAAQGMQAAVMGTLGSGFFGALQASVNTTPDAIELHQQIARYADRGAQVLAMEVSSHGLQQGRVNGIKFQVAIFTNLSRDHLDYHADMECYAQVKWRLFQMPGLKSAVVNLDDPIGALFATRLAGSKTTLIGYGFSTLPQLDFPVLRGEDLRLGQDGIEFKVSGRFGNATVRAPVVGRFNAANLLGVLGGLIASGQAFADAIAALATVHPVPGRLQRVGGGLDPLILVDYAHSPDGLEKALEAARELVHPGGRLLCVFGCGGNRDRGKRPIMGSIAQRLADEVIVTSDNPRDEEPRTIIEEILAGMSGPSAAMVDRAEAIATAVRRGRPGDVVLIAGKGHEDYQEMRGQRFPFDDVKVAEAALQRRSEA